MLDIVFITGDKLSLDVNWFKNTNEDITYDDLCDLVISKNSEENREALNKGEFELVIPNHENINEPTVEQILSVQYYNDQPMLVLHWLSSEDSDNEI